MTCRCGHHNSMHKALRGGKRGYCFARAPRDTPGEWLCQCLTFTEER